jgi:hypothetical protein
MARRLRRSFVVTVATFGASIHAAGCTTRCPESADAVHAGDPCSGSRTCMLKEGCGLNGWRCDNGQWREIMTYCNPPPPPQPPPQPSAADTASTTASATAPTAPTATATAPTATAVAGGADARAPVASVCSKPIVASQPCAVEGQRCETHGGCGLNGWRCEQGKWKEMRTFCNPPPMQ